MKKLFVMLMVCVLPLLALAGCGDNPILNKFATSKNGPDFLCMVSDKLKTFKSNIENKMVSTAEELEGEEPEINNVFDFSALTNDELATTVWQTNVWNVMDKANTENMFAMVAYNVYEKDQTFAYADLSFMSETQSSTLKTFILKKQTL